MKNINSENPAEHWNGLDVKGKRVLDLGCGLFSLPIDWNTPAFFLKKGAKEVYGIDNDSSSFENILSYCDDAGLVNWNIKLRSETISSTETLYFILKYTTPDVIKCDIEGAERYFLDLDANVLHGVQQIAVEYHDEITKAICENKFRQWGYTLEYNTLLGHSIDRIGVIYAKR